MAVGENGFDSYTVQGTGNSGLNYGKEQINSKGNKINITDLVIDNSKRLLYVLDFYSGIH